MWYGNSLKALLGTDLERLSATWVAKPEAKNAGNDPNSGKKMGCIPHQLTAGSAIAHLHPRIFRLPFETLGMKDCASASSSPEPGEVIRFPICDHQIVRSGSQPFNQRP